MAYLGNLTGRLAAGALRLPEPLRRRHGATVVAAQNDDGGFSGREGPSDLYYTGFALRSLALVGGLSPEIAERAGDFLTGRLAAPGSSVDFLSLVFSAAVLELAAGIDVFGRAAIDRRAAVLDRVARFRREDGGYAKTERSGPSSTYHTFLTAACLELVGLPLPDPAGAAAMVRSRQRSDGGFVELEGLEHSGTNPTAAAVGLLRLLDALDEPTRRRSAAFLTRMQTLEGGLRANTRIPVADLLSTFSGLVALCDLESLPAVEAAAARRYVESLELPGGGFRGGAWDDRGDSEYTFYGLGCLALLAATGDA